MTPPPCYDTINHKDCPNRAWCTKVGRSKCEEWVKYEKAHKAELDQIYQAKQRMNAEYEYLRKLKKRSRRKNKH